jgi:hypothetical protein
MTVRIEKLKDGSTGKVAHVETLMNSIFDGFVADGKAREECRVDFLAHADRFVFGPSGHLIDATSGASLEAYANDLLATRTHWALPVFTDEEALAFGEGCTLATRAAYLKKFGQEKYDLEMAAWGCSPFNLKPGTKPANATDKTTANKNLDPRLSKEAVAHTSNPFTRLRKADGSIDKEVEAKVASMIRAMGTAKVAGIAAAVGMSITGLPIRK